MVDELTEPFSSAEEHYAMIATPGRRRDIWEILPGKDLVLLRSGDSDLLDLLTCLCLYAVEARKIRERVTRDSALPQLDQFVREHTERVEPPDRSPAGAPHRTTRTSSEAAREFLNTLGFSSREVDGLIQAWPEDIVQRLSEITRHREMFSIDVRRRERNYNARRGELWTAEVARLSRELIGYDPSDMPTERGVHIISSNTHSVTNSLNPWLAAAVPEILAWGRATKHPVIEEDWILDTDCAYALLPDYLAADSQRGAQFRRGCDAGGSTPP